MSDYEQKDNEGVLFKNKEKESDNHPDYKGSIKVAGVEYWLSAWINESKNKNKYMKLSLSEKQTTHSQGVDQAKAAVDAQHAMQAPADFDDDLDSLPF